MRILIDTNIFIYREDPTILSEHLQRLLRITRENKHIIMVHPASMKDIENDQNVKRKEIMISKLRSYPLLKSPPSPVECIGSPSIEREVFVCGDRVKTFWSLDIYGNSHRPNILRSPIGYGHSPFHPFTEISHIIHVLPRNKLHVL